ncbi:hypothetical protein TTHERM_000086798 (macronuclear) [Tetrahymena thermophila SB210]|uniref:Kinase domain protein n=1 Tax=Tetrahymena thermophila (strain SB210) TaxID=312017 RepID=W7XKU1_TETTS|nr:hypothetical protein TTHERM_000086798 [Tetrahymena thermophila SB210]EWS75224.1 hypothetical protein TTHERM_000086798 [Tetrahymena thermophila SB210]|eukprot:XP_012652215.1 hypothetical protein TTHERM_000086798 [Tetrahymena thermophila SB210]
MHLSDKEASNLALALRQCISLVELDLLIMYAKINKKSQNEIVQALQNCKKMQTLRIKFELQGSKFKSDNSDEQMIALGKNIRKFKNLQNLLIWHDIIIGTEVSISLINGISECTNLSSLNLSLIFENQLNENDATFSQFGKLKNLKILKLLIVLNHENGRKGFPLIHQYLDQINLLEQIDFCFRATIGYEYLLNFGTSLGKCSNLKYITLILFSVNNVGYQGLKAFAYELAQIQHLFVLNISMGRIELQIPLKKDFIRKNKRLIKLNISLI